MNFDMSNMHYIIKVLFALDSLWTEVKKRRIAIHYHFFLLIFVLLFENRVTIIKEIYFQI